MTNDSGSTWDFQARKFSRPNLTVSAEFREFEKGFQVTDAIVEVSGADGAEVDVDEEEAVSDEAI